MLRRKFSISIVLNQLSFYEVQSLNAINLMSQIQSKKLE